MKDDTKVEMLVVATADEMAVGMVGETAAKTAVMLEHVLHRTLSPFHSQRWGRLHCKVVNQLQNMSHQSL